MAVAGYKSKHLAPEVKTSGGRKAQHLAPEPKTSGGRKARHLAPEARVSSGRRFWQLFKNVLAAAIFAAACLLLGMALLSTANGSGPLAGLRFYTVLSDSMKPMYAAGDVIIVQQVDPAALVPGDVISFDSSAITGDNNVISHSIRSVNAQDAGLSFNTYGIATNVDDPAPVPAEKVLGRYILTVPGLGYIMQALQSKTGFAVLIGVISLVLAVMVVRFGFLFVRYLKQRKEQR
jgi:signal peptidase